MKHAKQCRYCNRRLRLNSETDKEKAEWPIMTIDHIHPRSLGGASDIKNLAPSCFYCNQKKGDRIVDTSQKLSAFKKEIAADMKAGLDTPPRQPQCRTAQALRQAPPAAKEPPKPKPAQPAAESAKMPLLPHRMGWPCPWCRTVWAPHVDRCLKCEERIDGLKKQRQEGADNA